MRTPVVVDHPLASVLLTALRAERTENSAFRDALRELTGILIYEALRDESLAEFPVRTPLAETVGYRMANSPLLVPVLRAGLGMLDRACALLPRSAVGFVGIARDESTASPVRYMESLPSDLSEVPVYVLDPMLATGGSMLDTVGLLVARGARHITAVCVVAAPEGIAAVHESGHPVRIVTAAVDDCLNEINYIVPGLGDAGDRQFGPR